MFVLLLQFICVSINPCQVNAAKLTQYGKGLSKKSISAESAIVMDINTGTILFEKNMHEKHYPASITKIMTTMLCLENSSLTDKVLFSTKAVNSIEYGSSHIGIVPGEILSMEDCLYGIMLMSANEGCNGVAEHVAGSIEAFVDMMNAKANELGCQNTHFANTNGLFDEKHYSSAYDMALIAKAAMKNPVFRKITGTKSYTIPKTNLDKEIPLFNKHGILHPIKWPKYGYDYCIGGKTGYTDIARWTLVTFAKKDDLELVCVVMKTAGPPPSEPNEYTDTLKLLNYAYDNYKSIKIDNSINNENEEGKYSLFTKYNSIFDEKNSPLFIEENASVVLPNGVDITQTEKQIEYYNNVSIAEGINEIGNIKYIYDGTIAGSARIYYDTTKANQTELNPNLSAYINNKIGYGSNAGAETTVSDELVNNGEKEVSSDAIEMTDKSVIPKKVVTGQAFSITRPINIKGKNIPIWVLLCVIIFVILIGIWIFNIIYRARIRKKYFGTYNRYSRRKRLKYLNKGRKRKW